MSLPRFQDYASPPPHLTFSTNHFGSLTIASATELSYPTIALIGSVVSATFSDEIPGSGSATVITPNEVIPTYSDLTNITASIEDAFLNGMRSVIVKFRYIGLKICLELIWNCSNFLPAIEAYQHLLTHLQSLTFNLGPALKTLEDLLITSKIQGFFVSDFELYKLKCLLGESWLEEDVFNALLEFSYFYKAYHTLTTSPKPPLPDLMQLWPMEVPQQSTHQKL
ncbi:hypothetical protein CPB84DRAFT_1817681 [Gymnopilus junonius]|uniref:Uncharacterized protein n=1 Tax=Gymnopilus junonius TaxID=109634 RepID=A0A9P5THE4_GYMJU|nr:hypothetical protein CPB84DRAFT_1817681 [Gymnopilus junonius]